MKASDYKTIIKEESIAALAVILGALLGLLLDNFMIGIFSAAALVLISRVVTYTRIKNQDKKGNKLSG
jgi:hypothetical protein